MIRKICNLSFLFKIFFILLLFICEMKVGMAFPELVRHGYVNCTSCHVSPTGGGVLTQYGRELSREVLSTWGAQNESESRFAWGLVRPPNWIDVMGLFRGLYVYQNTPYISQGKYIFMENDLEAAAHLSKWFLDVALGYENQSTDVTVWDHLISRRHYLGCHTSDEISFRFGRFYPSFGINMANHYSLVRRNLGFDQNLETYNLEGSYIGEKWNLFITGIFGRFDKPSLNRETGLTVTPSIAIGNTYKVGLSYLYGNGPSSIRNVGGVWGILGFTPHFFLLTEWDYQWQSSKNSAFSTQSGLVNYNRLDYEILQGVHIYALQEYSRLDFNNLNSLTNSYGGGIQFFPRPHFELNLEYQQYRVQQLSSNYTDFLWLMLNIYI